MSEVPRMSLETLTGLIGRFLPVKQWGFIENIRFDVREPSVIYNSEWCRMMFFLEWERWSEHLYISYGRLHAPNSAWKLTWNGEECYCWRHYGDLHLIFSFLDGDSPQEAYKTNVSWLHEKRERIWHPLIQSHMNSMKNPNNEIWSKERSFGATLEFHASIWEHYGLRFFELFDLRHPELWKKYRDFLREVYEPEEQIYKEKGIDHLPFHQVC